MIDIRLIDADALVHKIVFHTDMPYEVEEAIEDIINDAPTIEQRWIPVKVKLPEPRIDVWVNSDLGQMVAYYDETIGTWYGRDYLELLVDAWMPLPDPYKEEDKHGSC